MARLTWPCLYCLLPQCIRKSQPIPLPFAMPVPSISHPEVWPSGNNQIDVACPECRHVSEHSGFRLVRFRNNRDTLHAGKVWWRISFRCGAEGCNTPVQFHVLVAPTITLTTEAEWREKLTNGYWINASRCGHPTAIAGGQRVQFERAEGRLHPYSPNHSMWIDF